MASGCSNDALTSWTTAVAESFLIFSVLEEVAVVAVGGVLAVDKSASYQCMMLSAPSRSIASICTCVVEAVRLCSARVQVVLV